MSKLVDGTDYRGVRIEVHRVAVGNYQYTTSVSVSGSGYASKEEAMIRAKRAIDNLHDRSKR
jgi:hypothetical protein